MLGRFNSNKQKRQHSAIVDDVADLSAPKKLKGLGSKSRVTSCPDPLDDGLLILEDREEGEAEDLPEVHDSEGLRDAVDKGRSHSWGDFAFSYVTRVLKPGPRAGTVSLQWQCVCRYHRNVDDPAGTHCTKTLSFTTAVESLARLRELRAWALAGRGCASDKRTGPGGHKGVGYSAFLQLADDEMDDHLAVGLAAEAWVQID